MRPTRRRPNRAAVQLAALLAPLAGCFAPLPFDPQDRERVPQPIVSNPAPPPPATLTPRFGADDATNAVSIGLGAYSWLDLARLSTDGTGWRPDQFGDFDRWGFAVDIAGEHAVTTIGDSTLGLGMQFGVGTFGNDGDGVSPFADRLDATLLHFTPTVRLHVPIAEGLTVVPGVGFGGYWLSIDEYDQDSWGYWYSSRNLFDESAWGGFASVGLEFDIGDGGALQLDNEIHWVDFEDIDELLPAQDALSGVIWGIQVGYVMRF